jgi:hypothetical protein
VNEFEKTVKWRNQIMINKYKYYLKMLDEMPLSKLLPKALQFSQEIKDVEFEKWIRLELHGYWNTNPALTEDTIVPEYRTVTGYYTDDYGSVLSITDPKIAFDNEVRLRFGVVEIEGILGAKGPIGFKPLDLIETINENLKVHVTTYYFSPGKFPRANSIKTELSDQLSLEKEISILIVNIPRRLKNPKYIDIKPNFMG